MKILYSLALLQLVFLILKLTHIITWLWLWVISPIWIPIILLGSIFFISMMLSWNDFTGPGADPNNDY